MPSRIPRRFVALTIVALCGSLTGQGNGISSGSVVVIAQTKTRVIMAADSRLGFTRTGSSMESIDDNACKIAVLPGPAVFAAAGILGSGDLSWSATTEAEAAAEPVAKAPRLETGAGEALLNRWAQQMVRRFAGFTERQLKLYAAGNDGKLVTGVLAGLNGDGTVWLRGIKVTFPFSHQGFELTADDQATAYHAIGKSQIFEEFGTEVSSGRAVAERKTWERLNLTGEALDQYKSRRLVELTALLQRNRLDVGMPVDQIQLDASGLPWVAVKPVCKERYDKRVPVIHTRN
jgi:hypothetical protein